MTGTSDTVPRFSAKGGLPEMNEMAAAFARDGVLVVEDFVDQAARDRLKHRIGDLVDTFDPDSVKTIFSTSRQSHAADDYFKGSGDKVRFFLEEEAFDANGVLAKPKDRVLNKIGHAMHDLDPVFDRFSRTPELAALARGLGLADPGLAQSMVIFKQPFIGGEVNLHQDATFLHTEPVSVLGFWFALEDADETNGCLYAIPGGHRAGLKERFRYDSKGALGMEALDATEFDPADAVPLIAPAGTLVVLHGQLPHQSGPNISPRSRLAYTLHVIDKAADWAGDNWIKRAADNPFRGFAG